MLKNSSNEKMTENQNFRMHFLLTCFNFGAIFLFKPYNDKISLWNLYLINKSRSRAHWRVNDLVLFLLRLTFWLWPTFETMPVFKLFYFQLRRREEPIQLLFTYLFPVAMKQWPGQHRAFATETFFKNGESVIATQTLFRIHFAIQKLT